jgi:hypothetical protein
MKSGKVKGVLPEELMIIVPFSEDAEMSVNSSSLQVNIGVLKTKRPLMRSEW